MKVLETSSKRNFETPLSGSRVISCWSTLPFSEYYYWDDLKVARFYQKSPPELPNGGKFKKELWLVIDFNKLGKVRRYQLTFAKLIFV